MYGDPNNKMLPTIDGKQVVAQKNDPDTRGIVALQLEDGTELPMAYAVSLVRSGNSTGLVISENQYGEYLKSKQDGDEGNNLKSLPQF